MADNDEKTTQVVDAQVLNIGVGSFQTGLANAVNDSYSYANSSMFCAVVAGYYRDYAYRYIRPACQWLDGYVPAIHWGGSGIISTRIASSLINGIARTIVGEKLVYKIKGDANPDALKDLKTVSKWAEDNNIKRPVKNAIAFALGLGTSFLKLNRRLNGTLWWDAVRFDNGFCLANAGNEVQDATFLLRTYTDTRNEKNVIQFFLAEHRYYKYYKPEIRKNDDGTYTTIHKKGDRDAMVEYKIYRASATSLNNMMASSQGRSSIGWSEIPLEIRKLIKSDYALIKIDDPQLLGFPNLGVELLINDNGDISIPTGSNLGRGLVVPAIDDFLIYELAESYAIRDMYNGKGTVYVPKSQSLGGLSNFANISPNLSVAPEDVIKSAPVGEGEFKSDGSRFEGSNAPNGVVPQFNNPLEGIENKYEQVPGDPDKQGIVVQQFELRAQEWQVIQENALKRIAVKWGMSPKILSSFLAQGAVQMTATQIDSEDDISVAFITQVRSNFKVAINRLLETTLNYLGKSTNFEVEFASPSIVNKDRILDRTLKKLEAGLIDIEEAIREINPDLDEETIQAKVQKAKDQQAMMMLAQQSEMNAEGGFGNNYDDLGGENLKGSTSPLQ